MRSSLTRPSRTWTTRSARTAEAGSWLTTSGRASLLAHELGDQVEHVTRRRRVELAGRLVGDQQVGPGQRRTEGDALLLAPGELTRVRVAPGGKADPLEQLVGAPLASRPRYAGEPELDSDELPHGQLAGERAPVMLVGVADRARPEADPPPRSRARPRPFPPRSPTPRTGGRSRDDTQERRLAGAARTEDDAQLTAATVRVSPCSAATPPSADG